MFRVLVPVRDLCCVAWSTPDLCCIGTTRPVLFTSNLARAIRFGNRPGRVVQRLATGDNWTTTWVTL